MQASPNDARDDDDNILVGEFDALEVAHILPHSLMKFNSDLELVCFPFCFVVWHTDKLRTIPEQQLWRF
jgi:hypothetical protein